VAPPAVPQAVKVGVLLPSRPAHLGEWLADGASFEVAGADALWVADVGSDLDPLALMAALAAVTVRSILVTALDGEPSPGLARTLATIGRLSHGRLRILAGPGPGAGAGAGPAVFRRVPGDPKAFEHLGAADEPERWVSVPAPDGRASWRAMLADAADHRAHGIVVPAGSGLLDMLRNPDDPDHRRDLQLAQG
jgi:hypothetical protein